MARHDGQKKARQYVDHGTYCGGPFQEYRGLRPQYRLGGTSAKCLVQSAAASGLQQYYGYQNQ
jgi:hypothetical protein